MMLFSNCNIIGNRLCTRITKNWSTKDLDETNMELEHVTENKMKHILKLMNNMVVKFKSQIKE